MSHAVLTSQLIKCPVCWELFRAPLIDQKLYHIGKRSPDGFIVEYVWKGGIETDIRPHHYDIWCCPTCYYCALREEFTSQNDVSQSVKRRWSIYRQQDPQIQRRIRALFAIISVTPPWDAVTVFSLHALAMWIHNLPLPPERDFLELARLLLRLIRLFGEYPAIQKPLLIVPELMRDDQKRNDREMPRPGLRGLTVKVAQLWPDFPQTEHDALLQCARMLTLVIAEPPEFTSGPGPGATVKLLLQCIHQFARLSLFAQGVLLADQFHNAIQTWKQQLNQKIDDLQKTGKSSENHKSWVRDLNSLTAVQQDLIALRLELNQS